MWSQAVGARPAIEADQADGRMRGDRGDGWHVGQLCPRRRAGVAENGWAATKRIHGRANHGGSGLEQFFQRFFPKAVCILDFYRAKEYLVGLGQALYGADEAERQTWLDDLCHRLEHEGGPTVRRQLETMDLTTASTPVREVHRKAVQYFHNHEHRMDYPTYVRNGTT